MIFAFSVSWNSKKQSPQWSACEGPYCKAMAALFSFSTSWSMTPCLSPSSKGQKGRRRLPCWPPNPQNTLQLYTMAESHASGLQPDVGKISNKYCFAVSCIQAGLPIEHERLVTGSKQMENEAKLESTSGYLTGTYQFTCWRYNQQPDHPQMDVVVASLVLDEQGPLICFISSPPSSTEQGFSGGTLGHISYNPVNTENSNITESFPALLATYGI